MAKVSKRTLDKDLENHIFNLFVKTIIDLKTSQEVKNFLEDLLSPTEKIMLVKRLAIAILLAKGYTYNEIDDKLKVSRPTIMNVSYWLKYGRSGYRKVIAQIVGDQKREALIDSIEETLLRLSPPKRYESIVFQNKQKQGKELFRKKLRRERL